MPKKTYSPYKLKTDEIISFRGIANAENEQMVANAYVESMDNLTSFRLREMTLRSGQERDTEYTSGIRSGKKTVKNVAVIEGTNLHIDSIRGNLLRTEPIDIIKPTPSFLNDASMIFFLYNSVTGEAIEDAIVKIYDFDGGSLLAVRKTNSNGFCFINDLEAPNFTAKISKGLLFDEVTQTANNSTTNIFNIDITAFVSTWDSATATTDGGTAPADIVRIPVNNALTYDFDIDWGDGNTENLTNTDIQYDAVGEYHYVDHTYSEDDEYTVIIAGTFPHIDGRTIYDGYEGKITGVTNIGDVGWQTFESAFWYFGIQSFTAGYCDTSSVSNWQYAFANLNMTGDLDLTQLDFDVATDFRATFADTTIAGSLTMSGEIPEQCVFWSCFENFNCGTTDLNLSSLIIREAYPIGTATVSIREMFENIVCGNLTTPYITVADTYGLQTFKGANISGNLICNIYFEPDDTVAFLALESFFENITVQTISWPTLNVSSYPKGLSTINMFFGASIVDMDFIDRFNFEKHFVNSEGSLGSRFIYNPVSFPPALYSKLLIQMNATKGNVLNFDNTGTQYDSSGATARAALIAAGWTIIDGGQT